MTEIHLTDRQAERAMDLMREQHGLVVTWEYPGCAAIRLRDPADGTAYDVWTGLNGWEYGTVNVLDEDNTWQPVESIVAEPVFPAGPTQAQRVADGWASWVAGFRAGIAL